MDICDRGVPSALAHACTKLWQLLPSQALAMGGAASATATRGLAHTCFVPAYLLPLQPRPRARRAPPSGAGQHHTDVF